MGRDRSPHDTEHTLAEDWPLALGIDERGRSIHACGACGAEIPDGVCAARDGGGVVAWSGVSPLGDADPTAERLIFHDCRTAGV